MKTFLRFILVPLIAITAFSFIAPDSFAAGPTANNDIVSTGEDTARFISVLQNDVPNGSGIMVNSVAIVTPPAHGTVTVFANGSVRYTPAANYNGSDQFIYRVKDSTNTFSNNATVFITVVPVNDAPVAGPNSYAVDEDVTLNVNAATGVLINDNDLDGDLFSVVAITTSSQSASISMNGDGSFAYTPPANFFGTDTFEYIISDNKGGLGSNIVVITVNPQPDAPSAVNDLYSTNEDQPLLAAAPGILANDFDVDLTTPTFFSAPTSSLKGGSVTVNANGSFTYTPALNFFGIDSFEYIINDNINLKDTAYVIITVNPMIDAPVVNSPICGGATTVSGTSIEPNGTVITVYANAVAIATGTVNNGTWSITTPALLTGEAITATAGVAPGMSGVSNSVTVCNNLPVAVNDNVITNEDVAVGITATTNDTDLGGTINVTTVVITQNPVHGSAIVNPVTGVITYTPAANYNGPDSIKYTVRDNSGALSNVAVINITVMPLGDPPIANDDAVNTNEDIAVNINILGNDSAPDGTLVPSSVLIISNTTNGTTLVNPATGVVTYTPALNYTGPDQFTYTVKDNLNQTSNTATVTINVIPVNDAPVAVDDNLAIPEDAPAQIVIVLANDFDTDGTIDATSVNIIKLASHGITSLNSVTGEISYQPDPNFFGRDTITYRVRDNQGLFSNVALLVINVTPANDVPVAVNDNIVTNEDTPVSFSVSGNDTDVDGNLRPSAVTITLNAAHGIAIVNILTGIITYTPDLNYFGPDSIKYTIADSTGLVSNVAVVLIDVLQVIEPPVAVNDNVVTPEDIAVDIHILTNDFAPDGTLVPSSIVIISNPANGILSINNVTGVVTYTPNANYSGPDQFTYTIQDNLGQTSNIATVTINVGAVNDPPTAVNDIVSIPEDSPSQTVFVLANDFDTDGTINATSVVILQMASNGTTSLNSLTGEVSYQPNPDFFGRDTIIYTVNDNLGATSNPGLLIINVTPLNDPPVAVTDNVITNEDTPVSFDATLNDIDVDGNLYRNSINVLTGTLHGNLTKVNSTLTYTPFPDYYGDDSLTYSIQDSTSLVSNIVKVYITVLPINDKPIANDDVETTDPGVAVMVNAVFNDSDVDLQPLTLTIINNPSNGIAVNNGDGTVTYTPDITFLNGTDTITYQICDNGTPSLCDTAIIVIFVPLQNLPPVVSNETLVVFEDQPGTINVLNNDYDPNGDAMSITLTINAQHGFATISPAGTLNYLPDVNYSGNDTVYYEVCDNRTPSLCSQGFLAILVIPINDAPIAINDTLQTVQEQLIVYNVNVNDDTTDGPSAIYVLIQAPANGTASLQATGELNYTPGYEFVGLDSLSYALCDGASPQLCDTAWVFINVDEIPNKNIISGKFFNDFNSDGLFNTQDIGQAAVTVSLYRDVNVDGAIDPGDQLRATRLTQALGNFEFRVTRGDFLVTIDAADLPMGYTFTTPNLAAASFSTPSGNTDADNNIAYAGEMITSYAIADGIFNDETPDTLLAINRLTAKNVVIGETGTYGAEAMTVFKGDSIVVADGEFIGFLNNGTAQFKAFEKPIGSGNGANGVMAFFDIDGLTYSPSENVFYASKAIPGNEKDILIKINSSTGEIIHHAFGQDTDYVMIDGLSDITDLAVDPISNTLYAVNRNATNNNLVLIDKKTGAVTVSGTLNVRDIEGLSFYNDGTLYATTGASSNGANSNAFFTIGLNSTNATKQGDFIAGKDFEAFTSLLERPNIIQGFVFHDENLDTTYQSLTEKGIASVTVNLYEVNTGDLLQTAVTDSDGVYEFILGIKGDFIARIDSNTLPGGNFMTTDDYENGTFISYGNTIIDRNFGAKFNLSPLAVDDDTTTRKNTAVDFHPLANDNDADGNIDVNSFVIVTPPMNGLISFDVVTRVATYTPNNEYVGTDEFTYAICDNGLPTMCDTAKVTINVTNNTSLPVAVNDAANTNKNTSVDINVVANDYDPDGSIIAASVVIIDQPLNGTAVQNASGEITYTPNLNFFGQDSLTYTVQDNEGAISNEATVLITVSYINNAPITVADLYSTPKNTLKTLTQSNVIENDSDLDGSLDLSTFTVIRLPQDGTLGTFNTSDSSMTYMPDSNFVGIDYFVYMIKDDLGLESNSDTVFINVLNYNTPPVAINDNIETPMDETLEANIVLNDYDFDNNLDRSSIMLVSGTSFGEIISLEADGRIVYQPSRGYVGKDQLTYVIKDENGAFSNEATVIIEVTSISLDKFSAPTVFSPNGDGKNDMWVIRKLNGYPINEVSVFNRAGTEVYRKSGYKSDWNGSDLPEGTYYYVIKINDDNNIRNFSGFVTIVR
jgi:large repetitive protein